MNEHTKGKQEVSSLTWLFGFAVAGFISTMLVKTVYELNDNNGGSGLIAIGSVLAIIYFSMVSKASVSDNGRKAVGLAMFLFGLIVIPVEIFSMAANNIAGSTGNELSQVREVKQSAIDKIAEYRQEKKDIQKDSKMSQAAKTFRKAEINVDIKKLEPDAKLIIQTNQDKTFDDLGGKLGIDNLGPIYKGVISALLIFALPLLLISRNGTWCGLTLLMYKAQSWFVGWLMKEKPAQKETAIKSTVTDKGPQKTEPMESSAFDRDFKAATEWVNGHQDEQRVFVGKMKKACKGGSNWQHEAILNGLKKAKLLRKDDNGGTSPLYYKKSPKQAVLSQFEKTKNFLNIVKK